MAMIPIFPKFAFLNFDHKKEVKKITDKIPPYSDYNFVSLWSYDTKNNIQLSRLNNNLVIKFSHYITTKPFYSFFGNNKFNETCVALLKFSRLKKIKPQLNLIPEYFVKKQKKIDNNVVIKEDRNHFDYIYLLRDLKNLSGKKYEKKRWLFNKFSKTNPKHEIKLLNLGNKSTKKDIINLFYTWEKIKGKKRKDTNNELIAMSKLIKEDSDFKFLTTGIFVDKKLIAFSINEKQRAGYAIGHFAKTNPAYQGVNEALYKYSADELIKNGCHWLNLEQDMGEENLRKSKLLWRPHSFLKKYTIFPARTGLGKRR